MKMYIAINNKGDYMELCYCYTLEEAETELSLRLDAETIAAEEWEIIED